MELEFIKLLLWIVGGLISTLIVVLSWIGVRIHSRLDSIATSLAAIEKDLRNDLSGLDRRVVKLETLQGIKNDDR